MSALPPLAELVTPVSEIVRRAGARIMEIYARGFEVQIKDDDSPVTEADQASEAIILAALAALTPEIPAVAEEAVSAGRMPDISGGVFWLVDPLDGTKEFIHRRGDFTVNIGLVMAGQPCFGVMGVPARDRVYAGVVPGAATLAEDAAPPVAIAARPAPAAGLTVVASRSHGDEARLTAYLAPLTVSDRVTAGSALKFALIAAGEADLYPRFGRTMEWDTAAGHAILRAAGGAVETVDGAPLTYGKSDFANPHFIAFGRRG